MRQPTPVPGDEAVAAACSSSARLLAGILEKGASHAILSQLLELELLLLLVLLAYALAAWGLGP